LFYQGLKQLPPHTDSDSLWVSYEPLPLVKKVNS